MKQKYDEEIEVNRALMTALTALESEPETLMAIQLNFLILFFASSMSLQADEPMSMENNRVPVSIFSVLAERDWRFSAVEGDKTIIPRNPPKSKPLIGWPHRRKLRQGSCYCLCFPSVGPTEKI